MLQVDDLVQTGAEQVLLACLTTFPWLHGIPVSNRFRHRESPISFARNPHATPHKPAKSITSRPPFPIPSQRLRNSSRTTNYKVHKRNHNPCVGGSNPSSATTRPPL